MHSRVTAVAGLAIALLGCSTFNATSTRETKAQTVSLDTQLAGLAGPAGPANKDLVSWVRSAAPVIESAYATDAVRNRDVARAVATIEQSIFDQRQRLRGDIAILQKEFFSRGADERTALRAEIERLETKIELDGIVPATTIANDPLFLDFDDYPAHAFFFSIGYEFVNVDKIFEEGFPRTGFLVSQRYGGKKIPRRLGGMRWGYGLHTTFVAQLTNSAEQKLGEGDSAEPPTEDAKPAETSFEFALQFFWPWARTERLASERVSTRFGLVGDLGGKATEGEPNIDGRFYLGFRSAANPELYGDLLVGRTESLESTRVEVRGQLPVRQFANGSRLFLGGIGNIGIDSEKRQRTAPDGSTIPAEEDVIRIYVAWRIDFASLFSGGPKS